MERRAYLFDWLRRQPEPSAIRAARPVVIRIADTTLAVHTRSPELLGELQGYFREYRSAESARIDIHAEPLAGPALWEDPDPEFDCRGDAVVQRDFAARRLGDTMVAAINPDELSDSLLNLLRWALPELLLETSSLLVHGASVIREGKGYLFFGQSGAGKSTAVRLIPESDREATVLGDDAAIIQRSGGDYWLHSAPLGSAHGIGVPPPARVPLAGLFSLVQSTTNAVEPMRVSEGMSALLASSMMTRFDGPAERRLDLTQSFALAYGGMRRLHFRKEAAFWPLIRSKGIADA